MSPEVRQLRVSARPLQERLAQVQSEEENRRAPAHHAGGFQVERKPEDCESLFLFIGSLEIQMCCSNLWYFFYFEFIIYNTAMYFT